MSGSTRRILAFPFHDWRKSELEGFRTRDAHLIDAIARRPDVERVLVIDRPSSATERATRRVPTRATGEVRASWQSDGARATVTRVRAPIDVLDIELSDVLGPVRRRRGWWFDVFARYAVRRAIDRAVAEVLGSVTDVLAWVPTVAPVLFDQGGRVVYDSLDNWLIHPVLRNHTEDAEDAYAAILPRADRVFVSGKASARALERWRHDIEVLPNGVDPDAFRFARASPSDLPPKPVVGYIGKLAQRIDEELVSEVAQNMQDVSFVFVGPVLDKDAVRGMRKRPNVVLLGDRPYATMPDYLAAFDVAWIPHRVGEGETGGDPIKLYEYWAAGRQVVSTPIDGADGWARQVRLVSSPGEAIDALRGILDGSLPALPTTIPVGRTWAEIAGRLLEG